MTQASSGPKFLLTHCPYPNYFHGRKPTTLLKTEDPAGAISPFDFAASNYANCAPYGIWVEIDGRFSRVLIILLQRPAISWQTFASNRERRFRLPMGKNP